MKRLLDEYRMTHQQLADALGKSRAAVSNLLRLNDLEADVKPLLMSGALEMGHARALLGLNGAMQVSAARRIIDRQLTVRAAEALVQDLKSLTDRPSSNAPKVPSSRDPDIRRLEDDVSARLGASVSIRHGAKGAGQIIIRYGSLDELDGVLGRFGHGFDH
jgi:ParB family chromosome partitioning protein